MTTPKETGGKGKTTKRKARVKRPELARSYSIRSGGQLPDAGPAPPSPHAAPPTGTTAGLSPEARAQIRLDEGLLNQEVAAAIRTANQVLSDTVAQGRVAAEQFRQGNYNMRDVPVDLEILGKRMIKLTRELSDTALNILEQLLKQVSQVPASPPAGSKGSVPPFPTGNEAGNPQGHAAPPAGPGQEPPSSHAAPAAPQPQGNRLDLAVQFVGEAKAKALPSPLWKPSRPTLPKELSITSMAHMQNKGAPITGVRFEVDLGGKLIATVTIPDGQPPGIYAGMIAPTNGDPPLGVLTIEIVA